MSHTWNNLYSPCPSELLDFSFSFQGAEWILDSAAKYLINTLLNPLPKGPERTYRFIGGNYSWMTIFKTLEKVQGVKYEVIYTDVEEARTNQQKASLSYFGHWR